MAAGLLLGDATAAPRAHLAVCRPSLHLCSWAPRPLRPRHAFPRLSRGYAPARFAAPASGGGGGEYKSEEEERREREAETRRRLKEAEEMDELERTAEELQSRASAADESEEEKRERVRRELQKVAKEQAERRATGKQMFDLGQKAYGKGMYGRSIEFLEAALTIIRPSSLLGGEIVIYRDMDPESAMLLGIIIVTLNALQIQIWLAMAYDANRRHKDCIALYKQLEKTHPMISIRKQAADFRYIAEAPKLKISNDEVVTIPQIGSSWDWYAGTWSDKIEEQEERNRKIVAANSQPESSANILGNLFLLRPPSEWKKSDWGIVTLWIVLIGTAFYLQR